MNIAADHMIHDSALPGLSALLDPLAMSAILRTFNPSAAKEIFACEAVHVRYKPSTNCVIAYRVALTDPSKEERTQEWLYAKCYKVEDYELAVSKVESKRRRAGEWLAAPVALPDLNSIVYAMADDTSLTGLPTVLDPRKLVRLLHDGLAEYPRERYRISDSRLVVSPVRYKPEKRAVFQIDTRVVSRRDRTEKHNLRMYLRTYADDQGSAVFDLMSRLYATTVRSTHLVVPRPVSYVSDKRLLIMHHVDGLPLLDSQASPSSPEAIERSARALAELHRFSALHVQARSRQSMIEDVEAATGGLIAAAPEMAKIVSCVAAALNLHLADTEHGSRGFVHGDFHPGQVLDRINDPSAILDFDRSYMGDQVADLGNFLAHLHVAEVVGLPIDRAAISQGFLAAYSEASEQSVDSEILHHWTLFGLYLLAISPFRTLQSGWKEKIRAILIRCGELI